MDFKNIIGNENAKEYLSKSINQNNILHSYLFVGTDGIGKALIAKEFSKKILCLNKINNCTCKSCISFEGNNHPDFFIINDKESNIIKVEDIRKLTEKVYEKPILSSNKIYIINDCDKLTIEAQNCLLKTLEEPPEFIVIILITSNENLLLNTIKSRCMTVKFNNIEDLQLLKYCKENLGYTSISNNLLKSFDGSIGKAIKIKNLKEKYERIDVMLSNIEKNSIIDLLHSKKFFEKENIEDELNYLIVCLYSKAKEDIRYLNCIKHVNNCLTRLRSNSNYDMTIDNLLINLWEEINENSNRC